ncbi:MAG: efflux RND transporter permease subunit [Bacteriovoracaceae bacterium]
MFFDQLNLLFRHYRLTLTLTLILVVLGIMGFIVIPKEEDPHLANRYGNISIIYPGAGAEKIQSNVMIPLEKKLQTISSIKLMETRIRSQFGYIYIELNDSVKDIEKEWNEIERILNEQKVKFPRGVTESTLDRDAIDLEAIIVSLQGPKDKFKLGSESLKFKHYLEGLDGVREIKLHGDPEIGMDIEVNSAELAKRGLTIAQLVQQVQQSNLHYPAGSYDDQSPKVQILAKNSIENTSDLKLLPILYSNLTAAPLGDISKIKYGVARTQHSKARLNAEDAVVLGLVPEHPIDILKWGDEIKEAVEKYQKNNPDLKINYIAFQPTRTMNRIKELGISLLQGVGFVILVLGLWMGWRIGLVVALSVPMISLIGFGVYFLGGGVLHQISLAALLLSLGQFIDNVTVIAEGSQRKIDEGEDPVTASSAAAKHFMIPMIFATGTAVASFLPLLSSEGATAEFTIAIPLIAIITLFVSYFFSIYTTPIICAFLLRPQKRKVISNSRMNFLEKVYEHPKAIVASTFFIFAISALGLLVVKKEFFPWADRNEFTLSLELPEGSSIDETDRYARLIETKLKSHQDILQFSTFVGQTTPYYYYSVRPEKHLSHIAEFLITTKDFSKNVFIAEDLIKFAQVQLPKEIRVSQRQLKQGAPVKADIEFEVYGDNLKELSDFAHQFAHKHRQLKGSVNLRTSAPLFVPSIEVELDETAALEKSFDRNQLAMNILAFTQGIEISHYFEEGERLPMRISLTDSKGVRDWKHTSNLKIIPTRYRDYSLSELTRTKESLSPTVIERNNGKVMVSILADLAPEYGFNQVGPVIENELLKSIGDRDWSIKIAGQEGESKTANLAILRALPFGFILLMACLLLEFRSFRKLFLVLITVGLVSLGVTPGLIIGDQPFGFMSLLGILALIGIVVNNAILIIEAIEEASVGEKNLSLAIREALRLRTRPIMMTTIMTLLGLLPLAFEKSTLWPPMAWAMISGLVISTILSLFFIPASYELLFKKKNITATVSSLAFLFLFMPSAFARQYTISELTTRSQETDQWMANERLNEADESGYRGIWRSSFMPKLSGSIERVMNDRGLFLEGFNGPVPYGKSAYNFGGLMLEQPLFNASSMLYGVSSQEKKILSQKEARNYENEKIRLDLILGALSLLQLQEQINLQLKLKENLTTQYKEVDRLYRQGKTGSGDLIKIQVEQVRVSRFMVELSEKQNEIREKMKIHFPDFEDIKPQTFDFFVRKDDPITQLSSRKSGTRSDIRSLELSIDSLNQAQGATKASYLPNLNLIGRYNNTEQGFLIGNQAWYSLSLQLQWSLFDGGVQLAENSRYQLQQTALELSRRSLVKEQAAMDANLRKEISRLKEDQDSYAQTAEQVKIILKEEQLYYKLGKNTLNQVLETERLWIDQKSKYIDSVFNRWKKGLEYLYSQGIELDEKIFE